MFFRRDEESIISCHGDVLAMDRFSEYRIMWLFVFFDLPTETKEDKKAYVDFRNRLQADGFTMMQYSVYVRHCSTSENADVHVKRVQNILPDNGQVSILRITDKQFGNMQSFVGTKKKKVKTEEASLPIQLTLF